MGFKNNIVKIINEIFSYANLSELCNYLDNDPAKVTKSINNIIKFLFGYSSFLEKLVFFNAVNILIYLSDFDDIEEAYQRYINKKWCFRKNKKDENINFPLDANINPNILKGVRLPSYEDIINICKENQEIKNHRYALRMALEKRYQIESQDIIPALTYTRTELISIDEKFKYYHKSLTGDVSTDFYLLYHDDREGNKCYLENDYFSNVKKIQSACDFDLVKIGNIYEIVNGRHRLLYLLKNQRNVVIKASVKKRIEDKEINDILNVIKINYGAKIWKNSILNDDCNLLIVLENKMYNIHNKEELKVFFYALQQNSELKTFINYSFYNSNKNDYNDLIFMYKQAFHKLYMQQGKEVVICNYTDLIYKFPDLNNEMFYKLFIYLQELYCRSEIFEFDFANLLTKLCNISPEYYEQDNIIRRRIK